MSEAYRHPPNEPSAPPPPPYAEYNAPPQYPGYQSQPTNYPAPNYPASSYPGGAGYLGPSGYPGAAGGYSAPSYPEPAANGSSAQVQPLDNESQDLGISAGSSFSDKAIRHAFIKKVYLILMTQLLVTVAVICLFIFCYPVKGWVQSNSWFYYVSYGVFIVTYIVLVCIPSVRRSYPWNFICLAIFTLALTYMAATISSYYDTTIVLYAMAITAAVCLGISLFAIQTKIDFTMCSGVLFAMAMVVMLFGLACLITFLIVGNTFATHILYIVYGALAALLFSLFLVFDTQRVVGGKNRRFALSPEEYITGALQLYLDIVNLFLIILSLFGYSK